MAHKLLVIEDNQLTRELYEFVFKKAGFVVDAAADGEIGLVKARQGGYDVILLDVMLPKLDGLGILKALKEKRPAKANGPIILLTNIAHDTVVNEALKNGAKSYLVKSEYDPKELVAKVKEVMVE